jgi:hypothetical protein
MTSKGPAIAKLFVFFTLLGVLPCSAVNGSPASYRLRLYHLHTGEHIDVVYRIGDQYLPDRVAALDHFLRDHRTGDEKAYDLKEFDLLHDLLVKLGHPEAKSILSADTVLPGATITCGNTAMEWPSIANTWKPRPSIFAFLVFPVQPSAMRPCHWAVGAWATTPNPILFMLTWAGCAAGSHPITGKAAP